jgi:hypothetical protein
MTQEEIIDTIRNLVKELLNQRVCINNFEEQPDLNSVTINLSVTVYQDRSECEKGV